MQAEQLEEFKKWFGDYTAQFYGGDDYVNANLKLKQDHTYRTCEEMAWLAGRLGLNADDSLIAQTVALFHDIGRFKQFVRHKTYYDGKSANHALLGLEVLEKYNLLRPLTSRERQIILDAIRYHGDKDLPTGLDERTLLHCKLIRDADKVDIYRVVIENYRDYMEDPDTFLLEVELPDEPGYSQAVVREVMNGRRIHYSMLTTLNDMKLLQLGWVFDVNFTPTLERIADRGYLQAIEQFLPPTEDIRRLCRHVIRYVESRTGRD